MTPNTFDVRRDIWEDPGLWTDLYHPDAAYIAWQAGRNPIVTFDVIVREAPFGGAYMVAAGVNAALCFIAGFHYGETSLAQLRALGYPEDYLAELARWRFTGAVVAVPEGRLIFPGEPLLRVTAPFREALLVESGILQAINTATLVATKAARVVAAAQGRPVAEFGFRRAQAPLVAAYAANVGGVASTSLVAAANAFEIPISGTIPHALIQVFDGEREAFQAVARAHPRFRLLLDTYDTRRGAELAAEVGVWARDELGHELVAVRIDSGDLDALSRDVRGILDRAGLTATQILASGDLDEWAVERLVAAGAPIDGFGVGTALVNGLGSLAHAAEGGALGGVYKLAWVQTEGNHAAHPALKIAGPKTTWPGVKTIVRAHDFSGDIIMLDDEALPAGYATVLQPAIRDGQIIAPFAGDTLAAAAQRTRDDLAALPADYRALRPITPYPVAYSAALRALKEVAEAGGVAPDVP